jgi:DNA-binding CsgD family transcriptional regulator
VRAAFDAGAHGYVLKRDGFEVLHEAIDSVMRSRFFISPDIAHLLVDGMRRSSSPSFAPREPLSPREREITQLFAEGLSAKDIASRLHVSVKTVGTHREHIMAKLGINGIATNSCSWRKLGSTTTKGTQIDLLIDRNDRIINICEMKFSQTPYSITKEYENNLRMKMAYFTEETQTRKTLVLTMITTYGILPGIHSGVVGNEVDMNDLFAE